MEKEKFDALLPIITTNLLSKIIESEKLSQEDAMSKLYSSKLYKALEQENLKVWHYSADNLYFLLVEEQKTGNLTLPDC